MRTDDRRFANRTLAQSCAQRCAGVAHENLNKHDGFRDMSKRDFLYGRARDENHVSDDPLGEPMTIRQVACLLGCSVWTVRHRHLRAGLPSFRHGTTTKFVFYRKQVVQWILENQKQKGGE